MKKRGVGRSSLASAAAAAAAAVTMLGWWLPMTNVVSSFSHTIISSSSLSRRHQHWERSWMITSSSSSSSTSACKLPDQTSQRRPWCNSHRGSLYSTSFMGDDNGQIHSSWQLDNDFDMFLNQCSIQSLLFQLGSSSASSSSSQARDSRTAQWVEQFTRPMTTTSSSLVSFRDYHGLAGMNTALFPTWDSFFIKLLQEEPCSVVVDSTLNFYETTVPIIKPASLCSRLLLLRQEISAEFVKDLTVIAELSSHTMDAYWDKTASIQQQHHQQSSRREQHDEQEGIHNSEENEFHVRRENLKFLELRPAVDSSTSGHSPPPFRKRNFDLLLLLTTQEAIHRVLNGKASISSSSIENSNEEEDDSWKKLSRMQRRRQRRLNRNRHYQKNALVAHHHASNMEYLKHFYGDRYTSHFADSGSSISGSSQQEQQYGRADAFMAELLAELPTIIKLSSVTTIINDDDDDDDDNVNSSDDDDTTTSVSAAASLINHLIDPTRIAQMILDTRRDVAFEWTQLARQVPDQHLAKIKRLELDTLLLIQQQQQQGSIFFGDVSTSSSGSSTSINRNNYVIGGVSTNGGQQGGGTTTTSSGVVGDTTMESFEKALRAMTSSIDHNDHATTTTDPTSNTHVLIVKNLPSSAATTTTAAAITTNGAAGQQVAAASIQNANKNDISQS